MTPLTPAGQALVDALDGLGIDRGDASHDIAEVEWQAADRALTELRREVEGLRSYYHYMNLEAEVDALTAALVLIDKASTEYPR